MTVDHTLSQWLRGQSRPISILVIGAGGNGSAVFLQLPYLHQALQVWGHAGLEVTVADGDLVSETNCVRQPFATPDIGLNKAVVLVNRVNLFWGLRWQAFPQHFRRDSLKDAGGHPHLIISCIDTRAAREEVAVSVTRRGNRTSYWLDLGNDAASGQYVLGQPLNGRNKRAKSRLRTVVELYPEITASDLGEDPLPSCSAIEALDRQEPYINQVLAASALAMLARLFRYGTIAHHGAFYNAKTGRMSTIPVDPELWARIRKRSLRLLQSARKQAA